MIIRQDSPLNNGYNSYFSAEKDNTLMDFGILKLSKGQVETDNDNKERVFMLIQGEVVFNWENESVTAKRDSFLDENPWTLSVPAGVEVRITSNINGSEICVVKTENEQTFPSKLYTNEECANEIRGKGTMNETSTRVVRTVFDYSNAKHSKLVIGEDITFPGKWSSFPPHGHPQPEIYYYKFYPENGYGFSQIGDDVVIVRNNDAVKILDGKAHPQVSAPGYAMYYIWVIRHLDDNPYIVPIFDPEHLWVGKPDAKIWPDK